MHFCIEHAIPNQNLFLYGRLFFEGTACVKHVPGYPGFRCRKAFANLNSFRIHTGSNSKAFQPSEAVAIYVLIFPLPKQAFVYEEIRDVGEKIVMQS